MVFVGRITRQKGLPYFLRAARLLPDDVQLVLCAGAPDTPEIAAEVEGLVADLRATRSGVVLISEMLPQPEVAAILSAAQVFITPSVYEPLGIVNLEAMALGLPVVGTATGVYAMSAEGPGSKHAPVILSLVAALIIGALAQKSRMCFAGSIRDVLLMKNFDLISIIAALFAVMAVYNLAAGSFHLGFSGQPIAHSQHLWNILGMYVVGFAAVLAGGCPLRQLILAGQGSSDSAVTFLGMLLGAAAAHNFGLAGAAAKAATETEAAVPGGPSAAGKIAVIVCIVVLFVIAGTNLRRKKAAR